jgi:poly(3-hydroxybutyrate) depolymerase
LTLSCLAGLSACGIGDPCGKDGPPSAPSTRPSPCVRDGDRLICTPQTLSLSFSPFSRGVHYALPLGTPPEQGWPAVVMFQGSFYSAGRTWSASKGDSFGGYWQTSTVERLLVAGFAVLTPETHSGGAGFWDTNVPAGNETWAETVDHKMMVALFAAMEGGEFGPLDTSRLFAAGISSGGYMTSRMALAYPGRFRALAIQSASWATCSSILCDVPSQLPADHPPTLFLHGELDYVVPIESMVGYARQLGERGLCRAVIDRDATHEWIQAAPEEVAAWFAAAL